MATRQMSTGKRKNNKGSKSRSPSGRARVISGAEKNRKTARNTKGVSSVARRAGRKAKENLQRVFRKAA